MAHEKRQLTKREWVFLLILIIIGEYIFIDKVFKYGADGSIVSYMSFAGTIISIVLAVLAIVYSYYQNFSQQRDSNNIATQVDLLRNTVNDVRVSKAEFVDELNRINEVSDKLDESISLLSESRTYVTNLSSSFESFRASFESSPPQPLDSSTKEQLSTEQVKYFLLRFPDGYLNMLYSLYKGRGEKLPLWNRFKKYYLDPWKELKHDEKYDKPEYEALLYGSFISVFSIGKSLGWLEDSNDLLTFHSEIEPLLKSEIESGNAIEMDEIKAVINKIKDIE